MALLLTYYGGCAIIFSKIIRNLTEVNILDADKRILLKKKLEENKRKIKNIKMENQRKQIINNIDDFDRKYRFADEAETEQLNRFISSLNFSSPAHIRLDKCNISQHQNMYLCFLCGLEELLNIYIYVNYNDFIIDIDNWKFFSPYFLLIDEDFIRFIYINDYGEIKESKME